MIYDCFMFYNENDCLDIRFQELSGVVDRFIIVEADQTFRGNPKPFYFDHERFAKYLPQCTMVKRYLSEIDFGGGVESAWSRETHQRNGISLGLERGLAPAQPDDIILVSDADEIPRRSVVEGLDPIGIDALMMQVFMGGINTLAPNRHTIRACRFSDFTTAQEVRKHPLGNIIERGGWEFSSLSTPEGISNKLKSFSHYELDRPDITDPEAIRQRLNAGFDPYGFGVPLEVLVVDDTWPEAIKNNRDYWRKYEW